MQPMKTRDPKGLRAMTNNEISRKAIQALYKNGGRMKFSALVKETEAKERDLFKNLFYMEEKGLVQLSTLYGLDETYPQIVMAKLRKGGEELAENKDKLDFIFPMVEEEDEEAARMVGGKMTFHRALELLADRVRAEMKGEERVDALERIESLLRLPFIKDPLDPDEE